jgi:hypothetical protein
METGIPFAAKIVVTVLCVIAVILIAAYDKTLQLLGSAIKRIIGIFH